MPTRPQRPKSYHVKQQFRNIDKSEKMDFKPIKTKSVGGRKPKHPLSYGFFED
jgi:hypothetical protein